MKVLVTGATGFLGRHLVPLLRRSGYDVRALVRPGSQTDLIEALGVESFIVPDISDEVGVRAACSTCQAVVHAAGRFRFWGSLPDFWQTNVAGTAAVMAGALAAGVERVIHVSSVVVVGRVQPGRVVDEHHPCRPLDFYQRTKLEGERLALAYHHHQDLPVVVLRPGAYYGPGSRYGFNRLFFEEPLRGWRIRVNRGRHITFPAFVPDVAQAVELALRRGRAGQIYHVAGEPLNHNMANHIVSDLAGIGRWRLDVPTPLVITLARLMTRAARRTGREPFYPLNLRWYVFQDWRVSSAKAMAELGFAPTPFALGAQATIEWYRQRAAGLWPSF